MTDYTPGAGDVEIELDGIGKLWLKPTLEACLKLCGEPDTPGAAAWSEKCRALNLEAITFVIAAGSSYRDKTELMKAVFRTGTINLWGKCIIFIHNVSNGGRPAKPREDTETGDDPLGSKSNSGNTTAA